MNKYRIWAKRAALTDSSADWDLICEETIAYDTIPDRLLYKALIQLQKPVPKIKKKRDLCRKVQSKLWKASPHE